ncbi:MAG: cation:proton antiporter, partial [Acidobacteriota bacterium]|nr:cation:proton antiporter [Acidobacteriota bacterium]
ILIGPSALNWIAPTSFLSSLADLGVMFLLFRVGMEVKSSELMRVGGTATLVAASGVVVPFVMGWGILAILGAPRVESIFVGAAMVATSVGITAQVLGAKGLLHLESSKIILAAAVIDDVFGLLVLAVVSSMARGKINGLDIALTTILASAFVVIVAKWGSGAMKRLLPHVGRMTKAADAEFYFAICLLFALSLLATYAGVAAIVGAFLAGMAIGESVPKRVHTLVHGTTELLAPFFLVGIGLHVDLEVVRHPVTVVLALLVLAAAVFSKFIGCGFGAARMGRVAAIQIGVGMIPRGEVGMVVAQIGLGMGVITQPVYSVVVFMAVATTLVAPPLIKIAFKKVNSAGRPAFDGVLHT